MTHTQPTKLPFITLLSNLLLQITSLLSPEYSNVTWLSLEYFNFSGLLQLSGLQLPSSVAFLTWPSITWTSFCTRVPRQMTFCREFREGFTDGSQ